MMDRNLALIMCLFVLLPISLGTAFSAVIAGVTALPHVQSITCLAHDELSFRPITANVRVLYPDGQPMSNAVVVAINLDYYFRYSALTNASGWATIEAMTGIWSILSHGPGPSLCPKGIGYFSCALGINLTDSVEDVVLQPNVEVHVELTSSIQGLTDFDDTRISVTETTIGFVGSDTAPMVGTTDGSRLILFTQYNVTARLAVASRAKPNQPRVVFVSDPVLLEGNVRVNLASSNTATVRLEFRDTDGNPASGYVQLRALERSWNPIDCWALDFPEGNSTLVLSISDFWFNMPLVYVFEGASAYKMAFAGKHLKPHGGEEIVLKFGGQLHSEVLITPRAAVGFKPSTQVMLFTMDSSNNVVWEVLNEKGVLNPNLTITNDEGRQKQADTWGAGAFVSKTMEEFDPAENPRYRIAYDFGPFGNKTFEGSLYDAKSLEMTVIETDRLIAQSPAIDSTVRQPQVDFYESLFEKMEELMGVPTDYKIGVISNIMTAGFEDEITHGFKLELPLEIQFPPTWPLGDSWIAHEMGHGRQGTPPVSPSDQPFGECFASLIGYKALAQYFGDERYFDYLMGGDNLFLRHLHGDPVDDPDQIMMFITHYIDKNYGWAVHRTLILEWMNAFKPIRDVLLSRGFSGTEQMATLYSYLVGENLAWIFKLGGFAVAEDKVNAGLNAILQDQLQSDSIALKIGETTAVTYTASVPIMLRRVPSGFSKINITLAFDYKSARILDVFTRDLTAKEWNLTSTSDALGHVTITLEGSENITRLGSIAQINFELIPSNKSELRIAVLKASTDSKSEVVMAEGKIVTSQLLVVRPKDLPFEIIQNGDIYYVTMSSNSTIKNFRFDQANRTLSFNVAAPIGTQGFCNVTLPGQLLNASAKEWIVLVDNEPVNPMVTWNTTHTFLFFTYAHSTHEIMIIREFPSFLTMQLLMVVTLLAILVHRRRISK